MSLLSYLRAIQKIVLTLRAGSQVSDRCPLGFLTLKFCFAFSYFPSSLMVSGYFGSDHVTSFHTMMILRDVMI